MDSSFSINSFIKRYNSDLANDYGNLVNRVTMLIKKSFHENFQKTFPDLSIILMRYYGFPKSFH